MKNDIIRQICSIMKHYVMNLKEMLLMNDS